MMNLCVFEERESKLDGEDEVTCRRCEDDRNVITHMGFT